ncbi:MAG: hypothetical protein ACI8W8_000859, partial [Rhodothermales bacterium]
MSLRSIFTGIAVVALTLVDVKAAELYVAARARPAGDGSQQAPFQSLMQVRDAIRAFRKNGSLAVGESVTVHVGPGVYRLETSFKLTAQDGGTAEGPVVYRAQEPGKTRIRGGVSLNPTGFLAVSDPQVLSRLSPDARGKVLVCDLSAAIPGAIPALKSSWRGMPAAPWLYVGQQPMHLARWPNLDAADGGWARFSKAIDKGVADPKATDPARRNARPGSFEFRDPRPARWNMEEGVWLFGYWTHDWSDQVIRMASYDKTTHAIGLAAPHHYGIANGTWGEKKRRFFAFNTLDELDAPGEWYLDRARKRLYFYPEAELENAEIVLATLTQPLLTVSGATHIKFVGLTLEYSHGPGIILQRTEHVEVAGSEVSNLAGLGVMVSGTNNTIRSCELYNLGTSGISMNGG